MRYVKPVSLRNPQSAMRFAMRVDVSALPAAIYYLEVSAGDNIFRSKFVKQ